MKVKRQSSKKRKEATRFVAAIIFEKLHDAPVLHENGVLMAEWLYPILNRFELIALRDLLEKKLTVDAGDLLDRISYEIKIF